MDLKVVFYTKIVTASFTTPAIVTVTALVTDTRIYSVSTCNNTKMSSFSQRKETQRLENEKHGQLKFRNWFSKLALCPFNFREDGAWKKRIHVTDTKQIKERAFLSCWLFQKI